MAELQSYHSGSDDKPIPIWQGSLKSSNENDPMNQDRRTSFLTMFLVELIGEVSWRRAKCRQGKTRSNRCS